MGVAFIDHYTIYILREAEGAVDLYLHDGRGQRLIIMIAVCVDWTNLFVLRYHVWS